MNFHCISFKQEFLNDLKWVMKWFVAVSQLLWCSSRSVIVLCDVVAYATIPTPSSCSASPKYSVQVDNYLDTITKPLLDRHDYSFLWKLLRTCNLFPYAIWTYVGLNLYIRTYFTVIHLVNKQVRGSHLKFAYKTRQLWIIEFFYIELSI